MVSFRGNETVLELMLVTVCNVIPGCHQIVQCKVVKTVDVNVYGTQGTQKGTLSQAPGSAWRQLRRLCSLRSEPPTLSPEVSGSPGDPPTDQALQPSVCLLTRSANTTLKRIMVGASLFGDGSVFETWKRNITPMSERHHIPRNAVWRQSSGMGKSCRI